MKTLITPHVNLNGTSAKELIDMRLRIMRAIDALDTLMAEANPHGRDYQTRAFEVHDAQVAWSERRLALRNLRNEIEAQALEIQEQTRR